VRQRAQHADIDTLAQARAYAHDLDAQLARAEAAAARAFAETRADMPDAAIDLAADVAVLQAEVDFLEAAGARSPAAMYRVPDDALARLDDASQRAVIAIANSAQATQLLQIVHIRNIVLRYPTRVFQPDTIVVSYDRQHRQPGSQPKAAPATVVGAAFTYPLDRFAPISASQDLRLLTVR